MAGYLSESEFCHLVERIVDELGSAEHDDDAMASLTADSLLFFEVLTAVEERLNVRLNDAEVLRVGTLADLYTAYRAGG